MYNLINNEKWKMNNVGICLIMTYCNYDRL